MDVSLYDWLFSSAQKGTLVLKEMLKIDSSGTGSPAQEPAGSAPLASQQHNKKRATKKLGEDPAVRVAVCSPPQGGGREGHTSFLSVLYGYHT